MRATSGRVLHVGLNTNVGLDAYYYLYSSARFAGVRASNGGAEGAAPQKNGLENIIGALDGIIAPFAVPEARKRLQDAGYR